MEMRGCCPEFGQGELKRRREWLSRKRQRRKQKAEIGNVTSFTSLQGCKVTAQPLRRVSMRLLRSLVGFRGGGYYKHGAPNGAFRGANNCPSQSAESPMGQPKHDSALPPNRRLLPSKAASRFACRRTPYLTDRVSGNR